MAGKTASGLDIDALVAQIEAGWASRDTVMKAVAELVRENRPVPLQVELASLEFFVAEDPARMDLKRRMMAVYRLLGREAPAPLLAEVKDAILGEEYATDFQAMVEEYSRDLRYADMEPEFRAVLEQVRRYTMSPTERVYALWSAVGYVVEAGLSGDLVECGVWRGGSVMTMAAELLRRGAADRTLWLYDTFAGLPMPDAALDHDIRGHRAIDGWHAHTLPDGKTYWAYADEADVRRNMALTGYPEDRLRFVPGMVEETIPDTAPERIALLRLDTDWYASHRHVLEHLYDRVVPGGIVIFDDYGHFVGARKAVDEFRAARRITAPLLRVDYSCRMMVKLPGA
jgi:hypothetical protein